jgi:phage-related protein
MENEPKIKYGGILITEGDRFSIIAAKTNERTCPFYDEYFLKVLPILSKQGRKAEIVQLQALFQKFSELGPWNDPTKLKALEDGFYEFKLKTGLRVFFYYDEKNRQVVILTHAFHKKSQKTPPKELERMRRIKKDFEEFRKIKRVK